MESITTDGNFEDILTKSSPAAQELAYAVRAIATMMIRRLGSAVGAQWR